MPFRKSFEFLASAEPVIDLKIGDRHLYHLTNDKTETFYTIPNGRYRATIVIEKIN